MQFVVLRLARWLHCLSKTCETRILMYVVRLKTLEKGQREREERTHPHTIYTSWGRCLGCANSTSLPTRYCEIPSTGSRVRKQLLHPQWTTVTHLPKRSARPSESSSCRNSVSLFALVVDLQRQLLFAVYTLLSLQRSSQHTHSRYLSLEHSRHYQFGKYRIPVTIDHSRVSQTIYHGLENTPPPSVTLQAVVAASQSRLD
jgi:hypothetical protein